MSSVIDHNLLRANNTINEEVDEQQEDYLGDDLSEDLRNCSISSAGSIDIHGQPVSSNILVALLDRPGEMRGLTSGNSHFYEALEHYIVETQGSQAWQKFQDILYKPREKLPDRVWMNQITHYLCHNHVFLSKFKESVGYEDEEDTFPTNNYTTGTALPGPFHGHPHKLTSSQSTGSINSVGNNGHRRSRRLSSMSLGDALDYNEEILVEEAPAIPEGMFASEDQFYHQYQQQQQQQPLPNGGFGRRRRSSYHSIQSEPHPTFVESKIDEVDEANIEVDPRSEDEESDHLADLLDSSDDEDDEMNDTNDVRNLRDRAKDIGAGTSTPTGRGHNSSRGFNDMDLIKLRDYPNFQASLPQTHASFFRKAKQLLSIAPSSRRFSATIRRNSILEDAMPPSPVTELDEPRFQTCSENEEEHANGSNLAHLICCTRRQQPDDIAWLNGVMEALAGWPELIDRLHDIIHESLEDQK
jgi:hypothetical protein